MPTISVIVPVYKVEQYLPRCIDSILAQTFTDFELILVDDGFTPPEIDICSLICDEYAARDSRIRVIHQVNQGQGTARNNGLNIASGDYIVFIDSDDLVHPQYLEILYNTAVTYHASVCTCRSITFYDQDTITAPIIDTVNKSIVTFEQYYSDRNLWSVSIWNKIYKKSILEAIRFPENRMLEDTYFTYRAMYEANRIVVTDAPLYFYYIRTGSTMHRPYSIKMLDGLEACKQQLAFFEEKNEPVNMQTAFTQLIHSYADHCKHLKEKTEYHLQYKELLKELRQLLNDKRFHVSIQSDAFPLETAYPLRMWFYWTCKGILTKFKK